MRTDIYYVPGALTIQRVKSREGPPNTFVVYTKKTSRIFADKKAAIKFIKWPKSTPTGQEILQWFEQFDELGNVRTKEVSKEEETRMTA